MTALRPGHPRSATRRRWCPAAGLLAMLALGTGAFAQPAQQVAVDVDPATGLAALLATHSPVVLGEIHGTVEVPALVGAVLALRVAAGQATTLALEIPDSHQADLDAWLAGDGDATSSRALSRHRFWSFRDGRSSQAMLALLERVREWRRDGARIAVLAFDVPDPATPGPARERHLARRIAEALDRPDAAPMLVLTGNLHARRAVGNPFDPTIELMAWHLRARSMLTFNVRALGGSAWVCAPDCGALALADAPSPQPATGLHRFDAPSAQGYDGEVMLARFTASPPAFEGAGSEAVRADHPND